MNVRRSFAGIAIAASALLGFSGLALAADDWDGILAKAKAEGVVVVHGPPGATYRATMVTAFNAVYPDIKVQFSGASGSIEIPKVVRERQAGIYAWDVWVSGPTGALSQLKDIGFFQPLAPVLRPETMAEDKWLNGFAHGWMDSDKKLFYAFDGTVQTPVTVNWDLISPAALTTIADLAKPEFAGKIAFHDPRVTGSGNGASQTLLHNIGEAGLVALYKNKVVYTSNTQQIGEWVVRGRYPIAIGLEAFVVSEFQAQGIGQNVSVLPDDYFKEQQISVGFGCVGLVDRAPHPNAAAVYINWLMSKAGQEGWVKVPRNSRRADVVPAFPHMMPKPGRAYFMGQSEQFTDERGRVIRIAKEAIDGAAPRGGK